MNFIANEMSYDLLANVITPNKHRRLRWARN